MNVSLCQENSACREMLRGRGKAMLEEASASPLGGVEWRRMDFEEDVKVEGEST